MKKLIVAIVAIVCLAGCTVSGLDVKVKDATTDANTYKSDTLCITTKVVEPTE